MSYGTPTESDPNSHALSDNITETDLETEKVRIQILKLLSSGKSCLNHNHVKFLKNGLKALDASYECLEASQTWLAYWIIHSLVILDEDISTETQEKLIEFLNSCQNLSGGFGGGPHQISHLAATYAGVNALCSLKSFKAYDIIDRENLLTFLYKLKNIDGSFCMHEGGEIDIRGVYCALTICRLLNIYHADLFDKTAQWVASCQTYEGGFGCLPGTEAHGGFTFCGFASLVLLGQEHLCNMSALLRWLCLRQTSPEGGFNGRTNKLVDSCYSFWVGAVFPMLCESLYYQQNFGFVATKNTVKKDETPKINLDSKNGILMSPNVPEKFSYLLDGWMFNSEALQTYIIRCCQHDSGSLLDKPDRPQDFYHTCYALSGLSLAQHAFNAKPFVFGDPANELKCIHPIYNLEIEAEHKARSYFQKLHNPHISVLKTNSMSTF